MILGRVVSRVVAPVKHPAYEGSRLLVVLPVHPDGRRAGMPLVAQDRAQSHVGDRVLVLREGSGCRQIQGDEKAPVHAMIVAHVDDLEVTS